MEWLGLLWLGKPLWMWLGVRTLIAGLLAVVVYRVGGGWAGLVAYAVGLPIMFLVAVSQRFTYHIVRLAANGLAAVGGLERRKGFDLLIDALAALDGRVHAVLVGDGTEAQRRAMEERARERGVIDRIHLPGRREDAASITAASDAFVLPSRSEGFAVAMLEAMAAGRPVVSADVAGAWEGLAARAGRPAAGWIVPVEDADALAAALREVVDGIRAGAPEVRDRAAEGAWRAANWFTIDRMIDGYEAVLAGRAPGDRP